MNDFCGWLKITVSCTEQEIGENYHSYTQSLMSIIISMSQSGAYGVGLGSVRVKLAGELSLSHARPSADG